MITVGRLTPSSRAIALLDSRHWPSARSALASPRSAGCRAPSPTARAVPAAHQITPCAPRSTPRPGRYRNTTLMSSYFRDTTLVALPKAAEPAGPPDRCPPARAAPRLPGRPFAYRAVDCRSSLRAGVVRGVAEGYRDRSHGVRGACSAAGAHSASDGGDGPSRTSIVPYRWQDLRDTL